MFKIACLPAVLVVSMVLSAAAPATQGRVQPPPRDNSPREAGTAVIRGRVLAGDTGLPLRRAIVSVGSPAPGGNRASDTDAQGRYEIRNLPAGRYSVSASKGSYVSLSYGQTRTFQPGKLVQLRDAELLEKIDFTLPRGAVITGRVIDEFGEPVVNSTVSTHRSEFVAGLRRLAPAGRVSQTNDLGEFRVFGLPPGQYYISASSALPLSDDPVRYTPTYYPGTANAADAQPVVLVAGQEMSSITIPLVLARTARLSGIAVDSDGQPMAGGSVTTMQWQGPGFGGNAAGQIGPDGSFTVANLAPGEYIIKASTPSQSGETPEAAFATVTVNGEDVGDLRLMARKPATVRGHIVFEAFGQASASTTTARTLQLQALRAAPEESVLIGPSIARIDDDGAFELKALPGAAIMRLGAPAGGWRLKAVRLDGVDVTDEGLDLRSDWEQTGVEVLVTNRSSQVSGAVFDAKSQPVGDYSVVIFGEDRRQWHFQSRFLAVSRPDQDGRFTATGLPPGEYFASALDYVEPGTQTDPEFLERVRAGATRFSLAEGEAKTLTLRLLPSP